MPHGRPREFDRDAALEKAMMVFWKHGYDAAPVAQLTSAMGIGAPSMYAAFGDKRALFDAVLDRYIRTYGAFTMQALEAPTAHAAMSRLLVGAAEMYTSKKHPPGCLLITATTNCATGSARVQKKLRTMRGFLVRAMEAKFSPAPNAHALALFFSSTLQGMSAQARDGATREELEAVARIALSALR